jgi:hypothetical protein
MTTTIEMNDKTVVINDDTQNLSMKMPVEMYETMLRHPKVRSAYLTQQHFELEAAFGAPQKLKVTK